MVQDILIHEAFSNFHVGFYMAVIVKGQDEVVVVFPVRTHRRTNQSYDDFSPDEKKILD